MQNDITLIGTKLSNIFSLLWNVSDAGFFTNHLLWLKFTFSFALLLITDFSVATSEEETLVEHTHSSLDICLGWHCGQWQGVISYT